MNALRRIGVTQRWSDVVIHGETAHFVEVAADSSLDARGQIAQVLAQIDQTLTSIGSQRAKLVQVLIYLANLNDAPVLNELWDAWVVPGSPPVRACVQAGLARGYCVEMVVTAAT